MWHPCHSSTCPSDGGPRGWEDWCHSACGLWSMPASAVCQALPECVPAMSLRDAVPLVSGLPATCKGERVIESSCQEPHDDTVWLRSWRKRKSRFLEWSLLGSSFSSSASVSAPPHLSQRRGLQWSCWKDFQCLCLKVWGCRDGRMEAGRRGGCHWYLPFPVLLLALRGDWSSHRDQLVWRPSEIWGGHQ